MKKAFLLIILTLVSLCSIATRNYRPEMTFAAQCKATCNCGSTSNAGINSCGVKEDAKNWDPINGAACGWWTSCDGRTGYYDCDDVCSNAGCNITYSSYGTDSCSPPPSNGTLTVTKVLDNGDGGNNSCQDFSFSVNGSAPVAFESDCSNSLTLAAGTYTITEPAVSGYSTTRSNCDNVQLTSGGSATCTITNNDIPVNVTINKSVTNNNGGLKTANNFSFQINGGSAIAFEADGSNVVSVRANTTHNITEVLDSGYVSTRTAGCSNINLDSGGNATCTITNDDRPSTLIVTKNLINDNGGITNCTNYSFRVNSGSWIQFEADCSNTLTVNGNTIYNIQESAPAGYSVFYNNCSNISIPNGASSTCTITNNDNPAFITVYKVLTNDNGGPLTNHSDFSFNLLNNTTNVTTGPYTFINGALNGYLNLNLPANNSYSIIEPTVLRYDTTYSGSCSNSFLPTGGALYCSVINNDKCSDCNIDVIDSNYFCSTGNKVNIRFKEFSSTGSCCPVNWDYTTYIDRSWVSGTGTADWIVTRSNMGSSFTTAGGYNSFETESLPFGNYSVRVWYVATVGDVEKSSNETIINFSVSNKLPLGIESQDVLLHTCFGPGEVPYCMSEYRNNTVWNEHNVIWKFNFADWQNSGSCGATPTIELDRKSTNTNSPWYDSGAIGVDDILPVTESWWGDGFCASYGPDWYSPFAPPPYLMINSYDYGEPGDIVEGDSLNIRFNQERVGGTNLSGWYNLPEFDLCGINNISLTTLETCTADTTPTWNWSDCDKEMGLCCPSGSSINVNIDRSWVSGSPDQTFPNQVTSAATYPFDYTSNMRSYTPTTALADGTYTFSTWYSWSVQQGASSNRPVSTVQIDTVAAQPLNPSVNMPCTVTGDGVVWSWTIPGPMTLGCGVLQGVEIDWESTNPSSSWYDTNNATGGAVDATIMNPNVASYPLSGHVLVSGDYIRVRYIERVGATTLRGPWVDFPSVRVITESDVPIPQNGEIVPICSPDGYDTVWNWDGLDNVACNSYLDRSEVDKSWVTGINLNEIDSTIRRQMSGALPAQRPVFTHTYESGLRSSDTGDFINVRFRESIIGTADTIYGSWVRMPSADTDRIRPLIPEENEIACTPTLVNVTWDWDTPINSGCFTDIILTEIDWKSTNISSDWYDNGQYLYDRRIPGLITSYTEPTQRNQGDYIMVRYGEGLTSDPDPSHIYWGNWRMMRSVDSCQQTVDLLPPVLCVQQGNNANLIANIDWPDTTGQLTSSCLWDNMDNGSPNTPLCTYNSGSPFVDPISQHAITLSNTTNTPVGQDYILRFSTTDGTLSVSDTSYVEIVAPGEPCSAACYILPSPGSLTVTEGNTGSFTFFAFDENPQIEVYNSYSSGGSIDFPVTGIVNTNTEIPFTWYPDPQFEELSDGEYMWPTLGTYIRTATGETNSCSTNFLYTADSHGEYYVDVEPEPFNEPGNTGKIFKGHTGYYEGFVMNSLGGSWPNDVAMSCRVYEKNEDNSVGIEMPLETCKISVYNGVTTELLDSYSALPNFQEDVLVYTNNLSLGDYYLYVYGISGSTINYDFTQFAVTDDIGDGRIEVEVYLDNSIDCTNPTSTGLEDVNVELYSGTDMIGDANTDSNGISIFGGLDSNNDYRVTINMDSYVTCGQSTQLVDHNNFIPGEASTQYVTFYMHEIPETGYIKVTQGNFNSLSSGYSAGVKISGSNPFLITNGHSFLNGDFIINVFPPETDLESLGPNTSSFENYIYNSSVDNKNDSYILISDQLNMILDSPGGSNYDVTDVTEINGIENNTITQEIAENINLAASSGVLQLLVFNRPGSTMKISPDVVTLNAMLIVNGNLEFEGRSIADYNNPGLGLTINGEVYVSGIVRNERMNGITITANRQYLNTEVFDSLLQYTISSN
jgi:hypothetical protein